LCRTTCLTLISCGHMVSRKDTPTTSAWQLMSKDGRRAFVPLHQLSLFVR
jgi:hypothetical protein